VERGGISTRGSVSIRKYLGSGIASDENEALGTRFLMEICCVILAVVIAERVPYRKGKEETKLSLSTEERCITRKGSNQRDGAT